MKPKYILTGLLVVGIAMVGYLGITWKLLNHQVSASVFTLSSPVISSRLAPKPLPTPVPQIHYACQSAGNIFSSPVTATSYTSGSYMPVAWNTSLPTIPTQIALYLEPQNGGAQIPFSQYSSATNITSNGTIYVTTTGGSDVMGIIPAHVPAGQYYLEIQFTFARGVLPHGALGFVTCSGTFNIVAPRICTPTFGYLSQFGSAGSGNGQFNAPEGIATDSTGNVYVVDMINNRIEKFSSAGLFITQWGSSGSGNGQFSNPENIAIDSSGNLYVTDTGNYRVQKFNTNGAYITKWGTSGSGNGQFSFANGIAIDSSGNVYVADHANNRIQKFTSSGAYIARWGNYGSGNGQFNSPVDVSVDSSGNIYVTDSGNYRVEKFNSSGTYITKWGTSGSGNGQFNFPRGVAVDSFGNVYITDQDSNRIQKFTSSGAYITQWGANGIGNGQFSFPNGVAVDSSSNVYIVDLSNHRVQKFGMSVCQLD